MAMLKIVVALCYLVLGTYLYINTTLLAFIDVTYRHALAVLFVVYGAFRLFRAVTDLRNE